MRAPSRYFWGSYSGFAVVGIGGTTFGALIATSMLVFRQLVEPWMPYVVAIAQALTFHHLHGHFRYEPADYHWIVGYVYALSALPLLVAVYGAYRKPGQDRRVDRYLNRNLALENSHVSTMPERPKKPGSPPSRG